MKDTRAGSENGPFLLGVIATPLPPDKSFDDLAQPSFDNCVYCPYKFKCHKFYNKNLLIKNLLRLKANS